MKDIKLFDDNELVGKVGVMPRTTFVTVDEATQDGHWDVLRDDGQVCARCDDAGLPGNSVYWVNRVWFCSRICSVRYYARR